MFMDDKEINDFWSGLSRKERNQFLILSSAFRDAVYINNRGSSGKFVEIPHLKKSYNSNIYSYKSPWDSKNKLSFEFSNWYEIGSKNHREFIISSNSGIVSKYREIIQSWSKFFDQYNILGD